MRVGLVQLLQKNNNISLSKQEVCCHTKQTSSMVDLRGIHSNDTVEFEDTTCIKTHGMQL